MIEYSLDCDGEVVRSIRLSLDPYDDIPPSLARALEETCLVPDVKTGINTCMAIIELLSEEYQYDTDEEIIDWIKNIDEDIYFEPDRTGELVRSKDTNSEYIVPSRFSSVLKASFLNASIESREKIFDAIDRLANNWKDLYEIPECMVGHLILVHKQFEVVRMSHEERVDLHSELHMKLRGKHGK